MKKYFKLLFVIITALVVALCFSVNAEDVGFLNIYYPIHKTDEAGKGLNGVQFTFSSGDYSLTSEELDDGDYLIDYVNYYEPEPQPSYHEDFEERYEENKNEWESVIKFLPSKYKESFNNIDSWDDAVEFVNGVIADGYFGEVGTDGYANFNMVLPGYIDETVAPNGYDKVKVVVPVYLYMEFNEDGSKYGSVYSSTYYEEEDELYGYFIYDSNVDYESLFRDMFKSIPVGCYTGETDWTVCYKAESKYLKDNGFLTDVADCSVAKEYENSSEKREELRFDEDTLNYTCILQIKDKKTIVNPETYGTLIAVLVLAVGSIGLFVARKTRNN